MTARAVLCCAIAAAVALAGCGPSMPDSYGIYATTESGRVRLEGQKVGARGTILTTVSGVEGPSGAESTSLRDFVVYEKGVSPSEIGLSRLSYKSTFSSSSPFGSATHAVNLWVPEARLELDIKPVKGRSDMYVAVPREPLADGFYALHLGEFSSGLPFEASYVFDIVVGSTEDYPSHAAVVQQREEAIRDAAADLLKRMNEMYNERRMSSLETVYRPAGTILVGEGLAEFLEGNATWFESVGKVTKSDITDIAISGDGDLARCSVRTEYEKRGTQSESVVVRRMDGGFFITQMN